MGEWENGNFPYCPGFVPGAVSAPVFLSQHIFWSCIWLACFCSFRSRVRQSSAVQVSTHLLAFSDSSCPCKFGKCTSVSHRTNLFLVDKYAENLSGTDGHYRITAVCLELPVYYACGPFSTWGNWGGHIDANSTPCKSLTEITWLVRNKVRIQTLEFEGQNSKPWSSQTDPSYALGHEEVIC